MVYIGKRKYKYGRMIMSHMAADDIHELHGMALFIGIDKKHFQHKEGKPHYDICQEKKKDAIKLGAKEVDDREIITMWRESNFKNLNKAHVMRSANCVWCKKPTAGVNVSYCDECLLRDDNS